MSIASSTFRTAIRRSKEGRMFFFEKKNQKTFVRLLVALNRAQMNKSLFASFSSEKEDSFL
jgi:hypothetical protein